MPSNHPSQQVTKSLYPTSPPSNYESNTPSKSQSKLPTVQPTLKQTHIPSMKPSEEAPTPIVYCRRYGRWLQSDQCDRVPSASPSSLPSLHPVDSPSLSPTFNPTSFPTRHPTEPPTIHPTKSPTKILSSLPTLNPTSFPTRHPTEPPTIHPTRSPTKSSSETPTLRPTKSPTIHPTHLPSFQPTRLEEFSLTTTFEGGIDNDGAMFDVVASINLSIRGISIHVINTETFNVQVYSRSGTWSGRDKHPRAWQLMQTEDALIGMGYGLATPLPPFSAPISVSQDDRRSFYTTISSGRLMALTKETNIVSGDLYVSSLEMKLFVGVAKNHAFLHTTMDVTWNGIIRYTAIPIEDRSQGGDASNASRMLKAYNDLFLLGSIVLFGYCLIG